MGVTINSNFWGDVVAELMTMATVGNEVVDLGLVYVSDNIQKRRAIPRMQMSKIIQPLAATPTPLGTFSEDERVLDPDPFMVYVEFDPNDFRDLWEEFAPDGEFVFTELDSAVQTQMLQYLIEGPNGVNEYMGTAILQGSKATGTDPFDRFDGLVTKALADPDVIDVANYAALTTSNIFDKFLDTFNASRIPTRRNSKYKFLCSVKDGETYAQAQKLQNYKGVDVTSEGIMKFNGRPVVPLVGMPDNCIIATIADSTRGSNIWLGSQGMADLKAIKVAPVQNNSDMWFFKNENGFRYANRIRSRSDTLPRISMRNIANKPKDNTSRLYSFWEWLTADLPVFGAAYAIPVLKGVNEQILYLPVLTGAVTINIANGSKVNLVAGDRVIFIIPSDATGRTVTWGTNIKAAAATLAIVASGKAAVIGVFDGTDVVLNA